MDFISLFTKLLQDQSRPASNATVKNYRADLNHFIAWYEKRYKEKFSPDKINPEVLNQFETTAHMSQVSIKRHLASLKKFYSLLEEKGFRHNPFKKEHPPAELVDFLSVGNMLSKQGASPATQKNYLGDMKSYMLWATTVGAIKSTQELLSPSLINEYKTRLVSLGTPTATINRKLASVKKLHEYATAATLIPQSPYQIKTISAKPEPKSISIDDLTRLGGEEKNYSSIPPVRLFQRLLSPYFVLEDKIATSIAIKLKKHPKVNQTGFKNTSDQLITYPQTMTIDDATRRLYAPINAPKVAPLTKKIAFYARHSRPKWYKDYHSFTASHYLHFGLLIAVAAVAGFGIYNYMVGGIFGDESAYAAPVTPPKILAFQGSLTDQNDIAITDPTTVYFSIYASESSSDTTPLWQESQLITPDDSGDFTAYLGTVSSLNTQIFAENNNLYLGVRIQGSEELSPRQRLANVAYASNTEFLQGMAPITQQDAGTKNVILALNSQGNLVIPNGASTKFHATGGNLTLSGQAVIITSNDASNGNVVLAPNGTGNVDIRGGIVNTSQNGALWPGSVSFLDEVVINATASGKPAFALIQNGSGPVMVASASGNTAFMIDSQGRVGINTTNPTDDLTINGSIFLQGGANRIYGEELTIESTSTNPLLIQPSTLSTNNVGIGASAPSAFLDVQGGSGTVPLLELNYTGSGQNIINAQNSGNTVFVLSQSGNVGLGTTITTAMLNFASSTSANGGILFGSDTNLYRSGSSTLQTDDSLVVSGDLTVGNTTTLGGVTYTWPDSDGTDGQVLTTNGAGELSWTDNLLGSGTNYWQRLSGTLSPLAITDDLLLGGTATSSALIRLPGTSGEDTYFNTGGNLGVGTTTPNQTLEVEGNVRLDMTETATTNGVCHSGIASDTTASDVDLVVCSSAPADIAEWYAAELTVETGHIVELSNKSLTYNSQGADPHTGTVKDLGSQDISVLKKASNKEKILGVVSTGPYQTIGSDIKKALDNNQNYKAVPIALAGRVLLKIAHNSTQIEPGDPITLSLQAEGKGTKALTEGFIVARALENWDHDKDEILVYIQPTWYQPLSLGDVDINTDNTTNFYITSHGETLNNLIAAAELSAARIKAGAIIAQEITVKNTLQATEIVTTRLKAGSVEASEITTNALALTSDRVTIAGISLKDYIDQRILEVQSRGITEVSEVKTDKIATNSGNELKIQNSASVSGDLRARSFSTEGIITANTASISGTLSVDRLIASQIDGLEEKIASISGNQVQNPSPTPPSTLTLEQIEEDENGLLALPSHKSSYAIFEQGLASFGPATFSEITSTSSLTVGIGDSSLKLTDNSLNSLDTLEIQPLAQAPISFMGRKITIDTQGNLTINGNALISGTLAAKNAIFENKLLTPEVNTGIISPLPEHDLAVRLGQKSDGTPQQLKIETASGSAVLAIDNSGNLTASGSGTFAKLNLFNPQPVYAELSDTEIETQGSAGKASIKKDRRELTIRNKNVTEDSLIYITPSGNTQNKVVYLLRQNPEDSTNNDTQGSFTVGISTPATSEIEFNWLIVN